MGPASLSRIVATSDAYAATETALRTLVTLVDAGDLDADEWDDAWDAARRAIAALDAAAVGR